RLGVAQAASLFYGGAQAGQKSNENLRLCGGATAVSAVWDSTRPVAVCCHARLASVRAARPSNLLEVPDDDIATLRSRGCCHPIGGDRERSKGPGGPVVVAQLLARSDVPGPDHRPTGSQNLTAAGQRSHG